MKSKNISNHDDLIDIGKIFKTLWKDKFIILLISACFSVVGYFYGASLPQYFETTIKIRSVSKSTFKEYKDVHNVYDSDFSVDEFFNKEFILLLDSSETLDKFSKKNTENDKFFSYIIKRNVSINYNRNTKSIKPHTINFTITLAENLEGQNLLNDYVIFVKDMALSDFQKQILSLLRSKILVYENNLEVAQEINLEDPILLTMPDGNSVVNEPGTLFYRGSKVLEKQLEHLRLLEKNTVQYNLNYNPILDKASPLVLISTPAKNFIIPSFFVGMLLSFFVLLVRNSYKRT